jgi:hypothetical protein
MGLRSAKRVLTRTIFLICIAIGFSQYSFAQLNLFNPVPKSINVDLANLNAKEYKDRFKQYKDTIKFLGRLEKQSLVKAKKELNQMPIEDGQKVKLKTIDQDFAAYKARYDEMDSLNNDPEMVKQAYRSQQISNEDIGEIQSKVADLKKDSVEITSWMEANKDLLPFNDTTLTFHEKMETLSQMSDVQQLPMEELDVDAQAYLKEYETYHQYLGEGTDFQAQWKADSTLAGKYQQVTSITDKNFGSYENYMEGREKLTEVEGLLAEANGYREGIEGILNGDLEKADQFVSALEARAMKISAMREAAEEMGELESYEASIRDQIDEMRYKADLQSEYEKHVKGKDGGTLLKEAMMKGKEIGGDHFKGHEELLTSAQQQLSKLKAGGINLGNAENMEIINANSLEGKGLGKRLVLGGNLQISRQEEYTGIDFSPALGYRWNKRYMWGIGGTYRAKVNEDERSVIKGEQVYGGRFYMEYSILSRFFLHGEYELMSHAIIDPQTDLVNRVNAPGAMLGAGIYYNFMKNIKGSVMILYNFLHDPATSPYDKPLMFRFGFNLDN